MNKQRFKLKFKNNFFLKAIKLGASKMASDVNYRLSLNEQANLVSLYFKKGIN